MPEHVEEFLKALTANKVEDVCYFAYQNEQHLLFEKSLTDPKWFLTISICAAKPNTAATYFVNQDKKRYIYFLGVGNVVQEAWYDAGEGKWTATNLGDSNFVTHEESKLAAIQALGPNDNPALYFQDSSGSLKEVTFDSMGHPGQPRDIETASLAVGTNLWALKTMDGTIRLFYIGKDSAVHQSVYQNGEWADSRIESIQDILPTSRIVVDIRELSIILYFESNAGKIVLIIDGKRDYVGTYDAECSTICIIPLIVIWGKARDTEIPTLICLSFPFDLPEIIGLKNTG